MCECVCVCDELSFRVCVQVFEVDQEARQGQNMAVRTWQSEHGSQPNLIQPLVK